MQNRLLSAITNFSLLCFKLVSGKISPHFFSYALIKGRLRSQAVPLSIYVTSACGLRCEHCIMGAQMEAFPDYNLSIGDLQDFLSRAEESRYQFDFILTGGEPTSWKYLKEGSELIKNSSACNSLTMFTNALSAEHFIELGVSQFFNKIRVSKYVNGEKGIKLLQENLSERQLEIVPREKFWELPTSAHQTNGAVRCLNPELMLFGKEIFACPHAKSITEKAAISASISQPVRRDFLKGMFAIKRQQAEKICSRCISNDLVRQSVVKIENRGVKERKRALKIAPILNPPR